MDKLPPEILHRVFVQLDLEQRIKCLLVCHSWWNVLDRYSLFYNIVIEDRNERLHNFINMFEQRPDRAAQVEELNLRIRMNTRFNKRKLFNIFSNARVMKVRSTWGSDHLTFSHFEQHIDLTHSKTKVESLSDFHHCELTSQLLYSNLGGRLERLLLDFCHLSGAPTVLSQLKDLPVLKKLKLRYPKISICELESIHTNIPSIQDFTLESIAVTHGSMPFDIIPAIAITKLDLRISKFGDAAAHSQLYQYMVKKYTNLIDIEYQDDGLEHYDINDRKQIYSDGILDFLKLIGPKKNKLHLNDLLDSVDVFEALDEVDAKIKELHFRMCHGSATFEHLCRSNLIHHIETLRIVNTRLDSIQHLKSMSVLTRLTIFNIPPIYLPIPLIECLAGCPPTVKYLHIESNDLIIKPYKTRLNSIESLSIGFKTLSSDLGDIISFCFPNLVKLKLTGEVTESLHITLQSPHLQEAVFSTSGAVMADYCKHGFSFKSLNQTAYYICNGEHKYMTRRGKKRVEYNELKDLPTLSVEYVKDATLKVYSDIKVIPC